MSRIWRQYQITLPEGFSGDVLQDPIRFIKTPLLLLPPIIWFIFRRCFLVEVVVKRELVMCCVLGASAFDGLTRIMFINNGYRWCCNCCRSNHSLFNFWRARNQYRKKRLLDTDTNKYWKNGELKFTVYQFHQKLKMLKFELHCSNDEVKKKFQVLSTCRNKN
jgi:hypothetical protein